MTFSLFSFLDFRSVQQCFVVVWRIGYPISFGYRDSPRFHRDELSHVCRDVNRQLNYVLALQALVPLVFSFFSIVFNDLASIPGLMASCGEL